MMKGRCGRAEMHKESPFHCGFALKHSALIRVHCLSQEAADTINNTFNDGNCPTQDKVWGKTLGDEVIVAGTCPPHAGRPCWWHH